MKHDPVHTLVFCMSIHIQSAKLSSVWSGDAFGLPCTVSKLLKSEIYFSFIFKVIKIYNKQINQSVYFYKYKFHVFSELAGVKKMVRQISYSALVKCYLMKKKVMSMNLKINRIHKSSILVTTGLFLLYQETLIAKTSTHNAKIWKTWFLIG